MRLDPNKNYARINNIIYEDGIPVIEILREGNFINFDKLSQGGIKYMNNYLNMFPNREGKIEPTMSKIKKIFYDCETTGLDPKLHSIHQLSGRIEIDGVIVHHFDFFIRPHEKALIEQAALDVSGVTVDEIMEYPDMKVVYKKLIVLLGTYCDRYNRASSQALGFLIL